jgi:hypothetical protein
MIAWRAVFKDSHSLNIIISLSNFLRHVNQPKALSTSKGYYYQRFYVQNGYMIGGEYRKRALEEKSNSLREV